MTQQDPHMDPTTGETTTTTPTAGATVTVQYIDAAVGVVHTETFAAGEAIVVPASMLSGRVVQTPNGPSVEWNPCAVHVGVGDEPTELKPNPSAEYSTSAGAVGNAKPPTS